MSATYAAVLTISGVATALVCVVLVLGALRLVWRRIPARYVVRLHERYVSDQIPAGVTIIDDVDRALTRAGAVFSAWRWRRSYTGPQYTMTITRKARP